MARSVKVSVSLAVRGWTTIRLRTSESVSVSLAVRGNDTIRAGDSDSVSESAAVLVRRVAALVAVSDSVRVSDDVRGVAPPTIAGRTA
jgi:hypothetical protein